MTKQELAPVTIENMLSGLSDSYIAERIETIYHQQASLVDKVKLNTLIDLHGDFTKRICPKTGVVIQEMETFAIMRLLEICPDEEFAIGILQRQAIANPVAHWLYTDGLSLDKLMEIDPLGYFVYAVSFVVSNHSPLAPHNFRARQLQITEYEDENGNIRHKTLSQTDIKKLQKQAEFDWVWQKKQLRERLDEYPLAQIVRINEILRQYNSWFDAAEIPHKLDTYEMLCDDACPHILSAIGRDLDTFELYLTATIKQLIWTEIKAGRLAHDINLVDYAQRLKMKERYRGLSNFFIQYQPDPIKDDDFFGNKRQVQLDGFMRIAGVPASEQVKRDRIEKEMRAGKLIAIDKEHFLAKPTIKAIKFSFGPKTDEIKL